MSRNPVQPDASLLPPTPSNTASREPVDEVQLSVVVPRKVRHALLRHAADQGTTARSIILRLLRDAGIAHVDDADLIDRRSTPNPLRKLTV